jgi:dihydrofolate reductase
MSLELVAARSLNNVIGNDSEIPWKARGEQKLFREITMHGVIIMGRKTYESIGRPLPGRITLIVTRNKSYHQPGCGTASSIEAATDIARQYEKPVFVVGGGEIYDQALSLAKGVHLTTIQCEVKGNVFFPPFPTDDFSLMEEKFYQSNIDYLYQYYERH